MANILFLSRVMRKSHFAEENECMRDCNMKIAAVHGEVPAEYGHKTRKARNYLLSILCWQTN